MWQIFKIVNFFWLLASTYMWPTALFKLGPVLFITNLLLLISFNFIPVNFKFDRKFGLVSVALLIVVLWYVWIDGPTMGVIILLQYLPVYFLLQLPHDYLKDLLKFTTKWLAILLIPAILLYWLLLFVDFPSLGQFVHPNYKPYLNYIFYIKTTYDFGTFERFNAFFLEPGHLALLCTFMMMANDFKFKSCKWLYVLAVSVAFSFSLAGYLLFVVGFVMLKTNTLGKALAVSAVAIVLAVGAVSFLGEDSAVYELIVSRLEYDESKGIKGNNRFTEYTDYAYDKSEKNGAMWYGIKNDINMDRVEGAGYKIYVIKYGWIGVIVSALFYLAVIPGGADFRFTLSFLVVLVLCFAQRSYPTWYSWLFPFVVGIYMHKKDSPGIHTPLPECLNP